MIARIRRTLTTLAVVLLAFGAYRAVAVPLIEPSIDRWEGNPDSLGGVDPYQKVLDRQLDALRDILPPGSWELNSPRILETSRGMLVIKDYRNLGDGYLEMKPCTMVLFAADEAATPEERNRRAIVMQAPDGAVLQFDGDVDLGRFEVRQLLGASIEGEVTIRSDNREPGPEDDLYIVTHDVEMDEEAIKTDAAVDFHLGENHGHGRGMRITLLRADGPAQVGAGPNIQGVERLELLDDVHMVGQLALDRMFEDEGSADESPEEAEPVPVEIVCDGTFEFDLAEYFLAFHRAVLVERKLPDVPPDTLRCDDLFLYLTTAAPDGTPLAEPQPQEPGRFKMPKLLPKRIVAQGEHVVLEMPASEVLAIGQSLQYDFLKDTAALVGAQPAQLRQKTNTIQSAEIYYRRLEGRTLGSFLARGPGQLVTALPGEEPQPVEARWTKELRLYPDPEQPTGYIVAARGDAYLAAAGLGSLDAQEVYAWLHEVVREQKIVATAAPPSSAVSGGGGSDAERFVPDKVLAIDNVHIESPRLVADLNRLEMWFESASAATSTVDVRRHRTAGDRRVLPVVYRSDAREPVVARLLALREPAGVLETNHHNAPSRVALAAVPGLPVPGNPLGDMMGPAAGLPSRLRLRGGKLQAQVLLQGSEPMLGQLIVQEDVELVELPASDRAPSGLRIAGDHIYVKQTDPADAEVTVTGTPAEIEARGLQLEGGQVNLLRGQNRLWVHGAGAMTIAGREVEQLQELGDGTMRLQWAAGMEFDGQTAVLSESVIGETGQQTLRTELMHVRLDQRIDFSSSRMETQPQVSLVECRGGVVLEGRELDARGTLESQMRMEVATATVRQPSGDVECSGPGNLVLRRVGGPEAPAMLSGRGRAPAQAQPQDGLTYLEVKFIGGVVGNLQQRQMTFQRQVRTVYGRVPDWNSKVELPRGAELPESVVLLNCDQLGLAQMPAADASGRFMEIECLGNPVVEGRLFTARGHRISYVEAKDLLTLEGGSRGAAELHVRRTISDPWQHQTAGRIEYRPSTGEATIGDARSLDLLQLPGQ